MFYTFLINYLNLITVNKLIEYVVSIHLYAPADT